MTIGTRFVNESPTSASAATIAEGKHLALLRRGRWEFVARRDIGGTVGIVAVTDAGGLLLVEQFRRPLNQRTLELPAGLAGDSDGTRGESLLTAARRELVEETGYEAAEWRAGPQLATSAGLTDEAVTFFLARGLKKVGESGGDAGESIILHEAPLATFDAWLDERLRQGAAVESRVLAGLYLWRRWGGEPW